MSQEKLSTQSELNKTVTSELVCRHCGKPEREHCVFESPIPEGCQCDVGTWDGEVGPICDEYVGNGVEYCQRCEHECACHKSVVTCGHPQHEVSTKSESSTKETEKTATEESTELFASLPAKQRVGAAKKELMKIVNQVFREVRGRDYCTNYGSQAERAAAYKIYNSLCGRDARKFERFWRAVCEDWDELKCMAWIRRYPLPPPTLALAAEHYQALFEELFPDAVKKRKGGKVC